MPKDNFSKQSADYLRYRPDYPEALFQALLTLVPRRERAWDCATGNGQAALALARHFEEVYASDISSRQLALAPARPNIHYQVAEAAAPPYPDKCFDLVTVAQAYHWLAGDAFFQAIERVLRPDGIIAVWCYGLLNSSYPLINETIGQFYSATLGAYWDKERRWIDEKLQTIPFPFFEREAPAGLAIERCWSLNDLLGYFNSWSAVQHFIEHRGYNPVAELQPLLARNWPAGDKLDFRFPLYIRFGQLNKNH